MSNLIWQSTACAECQMKCGTFPKEVGRSLSGSSPQRAHTNATRLDTGADCQKKEMDLDRREHSSEKSPKTLLRFYPWKGTPAFVILECGYHEASSPYMRLPNLFQSYRTPRAREPRQALRGHGHHDAAVGTGCTFRTSYGWYPSKKPEIEPLRGNGALIILSSGYAGCSG